MAAGEVRAANCRPADRYSQKAAIPPSEFRARYETASQQQRRALASALAHRPGRRPRMARATGGNQAHQRGGRSRAGQCGPTEPGGDRQCASGSKSGGERQPDQSNPSRPRRGAIDAGVGSPERGADAGGRRRLRRGRCPWEENRWCVTSLKCASRSYEPLDGRPPQFLAAFDLADPCKTVREPHCFIVCKETGLHHRKLEAGGAP
jgi:hypothetical protein